MLRFAANIGWMYTELPMAERFQAARRHGFTAVECPLFYDFPAADLANWCESAGLAFIMFNAPPGDMSAGEYGLSGLPGRQGEFQDSIGIALEYARALKSSFIHVLAGIVPDEVGRERCFEVYVENLKWTAEVCALHHVGVLIEPINTIERPGYLTTLTREARAAIDAVSHPNIGIQFDFHNAQLMEGRLTEALENNITVIRHIQIAGVPGRTPPDMNEMNYPYLFNVIERLGYSGWIGCEYRSPAATGDSLGWEKDFGLG
jgi:hydroxypyruvate isomerase